MYAAKANYLDAQIGKVIAALKAAGMYESTIVIAAADNGGPLPSANTNAPLRGGKHGFYEGGVRVVGFVGGGAVPPARRGTAEAGFMTVADIYPTLCALAGADPTDARAAAAGLPPVDGVNQWPFLSGATTTSPRTEVPIGSDATEANLLHLSNATVVQGLVRADGWKLLIGETGQNIWTGPQYPNKSTSWKDVPYHCGVPSSPPVGKGGCLFNILTDPTEHHDVAARHPDIVAEMYARLLELQKTAFGPHRGKDDGIACKAALNTWRGFWGPFLA
jgi:arylsulfatase I/J